MADINVLVVVDTENINHQNLSQTVTLVDDHLDSDTTKGDSETFTINVKPRDKVRFRITAVNENTEVRFEDFCWEDTTRSNHCFDPMPQFNNSWIGFVVGEPGEHENFSITFRVGGEMNFDSTYTLDPKLKVMQSGGGGTIIPS